MQDLYPCPFKEPAKDKHLQIRKQITTDNHHEPVLNFSSTKIKNCTAIVNLCDAAPSLAHAVPSPTQQPPPS
jgi:hypothetical protein